MSITSPNFSHGRKTDIQLPPLSPPGSGAGLRPSPCPSVTMQVLQVLRPKTRASRFLSRPLSNLSENPTGPIFNVQYSPPSLLRLAPAASLPPGRMQTPPNRALISVVSLPVLASHRGQRGPITAYAPEQVASPLRPYCGPHLWGLGAERRT